MKSAELELPQEAGVAKRETGTIARTIMVLRAVAESKVEPTLKDLADEVNLPLSTMHRLLELLIKEGMVLRDENNKTFRPGLEFFRLASHVVHRMPLRTIARPFLANAARDGNESSYLGLLDGKANKLLFAASGASDHMLDYRMPLNVPNSLIIGASGLAILAWLDPDRIDLILKQEAAQGDPSTSGVRRDTLLPALAQIREQGYANTFGQRIKGAVGFFAPVFDAEGHVCASFGFTVPQVRFDASVSTLLIHTILHHAGGLSKALGYSGAYPRPAQTYPVN